MAQMQGWTGTKKSALAFFGPGGPPPPYKNIYIYIYIYDIKGFVVDYGELNNLYSVYNVYTCFVIFTGI